LTRLPITSAVSIALAGLALSSCTEGLEPGEYGTFRYVGQVRGEPPTITLLPPTSDRAGNVYVLFGALDQLETELFVGTAGGGWTGGCSIQTGNEYGVHGWVGRATQRAWYWSGDALVEASGPGGCTQVLETDPASGAVLRFRAVVPWVRDTPSSTTTLAWVQAFGDSVPFQVVVDLDTGIYTDAGKFSPSNAEDLVVLGVGGNVERREGVVLVRYRRGDSVRVEARFIDEEANTTAKPRLKGLDELPEYGIVGHLQSNDQGLYAGLDVEGKVVVFDKDGGKRKSVKGMVPVGVHRWEGNLYLVGTNGSGKSPRIAKIDNDGGIGSSQRWESSANAFSNLKKTVEIVDDRRLPATDTTWKRPRSAMGPFPFIHPHNPDHYADDTTTWIVAGPGFDVGGDPFRAIAFVPVGVRYP